MLQRSVKQLQVFGETVGIFAENAYFLVDVASRDAIAFDPGDEPEILLAILADHELRLKLILNTHAHIDHVGAVQALKDATGAPFYLHPAERQLLRSLPAQAALFGLEAPAVPEIDGDLAEGQTFSLGSSGTTIRVHLTPGHSPGSVTFEVADMLFSGDVLFEDSIGRTDLPGGDPATLLDSIHRKLLVFADETVVFPGHGPATTIGRERLSNPYLRGPGG